MSILSAASTGGDASRWAPSALANTTARRYQLHHNSNDYGLLTHILFNILARSGDIETQPGPRPPISCNRSNGIKAKCLKCDTSTRFRRFVCSGCTIQGEALCPYCLTDEIINHCNLNNIIREFKCKLCIANSDNNSVNINGNNSDDKKPSMF